MKSLYIATVTLLAPVGLFLIGILLKLGIEQSLTLYGTTFTVIAGLGFLPVCLGVAFLFDKQEAAKSAPEDQWRS